MKPIVRIGLILACCISSSFAQPGPPPQRPQPPGYFISASDFHFNPFYDPSLVAKLIGSPVKNWQRIFESSAITTPNSFNADANYPLFKSALAAMQKQVRNPRFMLISGDFLCHEFQSKYASAPGSNPDSLNAFTAKTIQFIAGMVNRYFPQTVVLPVLGNNDSYAGDYAITEYSPFLPMFAKAWAPLLRLPAAEEQAFIGQFSTGGYYTYTFTGGEPLRIMLMNTVFCSSSADSAAVNNIAETEMQWLEGQLEGLRKTGIKTWLVYHIPPGINVYPATTQTDCAAGAVPMMWRSTLNTRFLAILRNYADVIGANFAGHTHMDDFRVIYDANKQPVNFIHITPAISPVYDNNPGFQRITYNTANWQLQNAETWYYNLNATTPSWQAEYNFNKAYGVSGINAASLDTVRKQMLANWAIHQNYVGFYPVSNYLSGGITPFNWTYYWCGTGALTPDAFCNCGKGFPMQ